jgi:Ca2+/Na+ antiporter
MEQTMLRRIRRTEAVVLLAAGAAVGAILVAIQVPVWSVYVAVAVAAIVYAVVTARRSRGDYRSREDEPKPNAPHPERASLARAGGPR